jgi:hypothetical protein
LPLCFCQFISLGHLNTSLLSIQAIVKQIQPQKKSPKCRFCLAKLSGRVVFSPPGYGVVPASGNYYNNNTPRFIKRKFGLIDPLLNTELEKFEP